MQSQNSFFLEISFHKIQNLNSNEPETPITFGSLSQISISLFSLSCQQRQMMSYVSFDSTIRCPFLPVKARKEQKIFSHTLLKNLVMWVCKQICCCICHCLTEHAPFIPRQNCIIISCSMLVYKVVRTMHVYITYDLLNNSQALRGWLQQLPEVCENIRLYFVPQTVQ